MKKLKRLSLLFLGAMMTFTLHAQTTTIHGLVVVVNYNDHPLNAGLDTIDNMMNQTSGFTAWGNNGSVREYFNHQSNGKVDVISHIIDVELDSNFMAFHAENLPYNGGQELVRHVVDKINAKYTGGFTGLTVRPDDDQLWHFTILCNGPKGIGVAYGAPDGLTITNNGVPLPVKGVAVCGYTDQKPEINVICHELGHSIFGWTDYYNTVHAKASNMGHYCLMGSGGRRGNPMHISAGLRYKKGWIGNVIDITTSGTQTYTATSNDPDQVYKYTNLFNSKEYYLIEPYTHSRYYINLDGDNYVPDQGLAIWYVDEDGGMDNPTSPVDLKIRLVQADGLDEMRDRSTTHFDQRGDHTDLFDNTYNVFNDSIYHRFRWKNGNETGLILTDISAIGSTMSFKVNARPNTVTATFGSHGTIAPGGLVSVKSGHNRTFQIVPEFGYEVDNVWVNSVAQGAITSYTFNTVTSDQSVHANFKLSTNGYTLPSPWQHSFIGSGINTGIGGYKNNTFGIETHGADIWGGADDFNFIYQSLNGNGEIVARIAGMNTASDWSKSGVMIRESLNANSKHVMIVRTPSNGIAPQYRPSTGGGSYHNVSGTQAIDTLRGVSWLKLTRTGNEFKSYYSYNGTAWTLLETTTISMSSNVYIGLCASGASATTPNKTQFDQVTVTSSNASGLLTQFAVPRATALSSIYATYSYVHTLGTGGPNLSNVSQAVINWDLANNGLYQFSLQTNNGNPYWYQNIPGHATHTFNQSAPGITISSSVGFTNLAGAYYVNTHSGNLVLVEQSGAYALYFSNSASAPVLRKSEGSAAGFIANVSASPNPFAENVAITIPESFGEVTLTVSNALGKQMEQRVSSGNTFVGDEYPGGMYFVRIEGNGFTETLKIIKR